MAGRVKILSVEQVLEAPDLEERVIEVPEWGGAVRIRSFSKATQQELRKKATVKGEIDGDRLEMLMFIHGVVDPAFTEEHYELLRKKSAGAIDRVLRAILELSGLTREAVEEAKRSFPEES
ncbi:MAG: hypothetical protein GXP39_07910 [Chloroflexi bacterium]|nr:hypothetical protein [Chloroflexota bacterium]